MNCISLEEEEWALIIRMTYIFLIPELMIYALSTIPKEYRLNNVHFISKYLIYNFKVPFVMGIRSFSMEVSIQNMSSMIIMFTILPTKHGHPVNLKDRFQLQGKNHP